MLTAEVLEAHCNVDLYLKRPKMAVICAAEWCERIWKVSFICSVFTKLRFLYLDLGKVLLIRYSLISSFVFFAQVVQL